MNTNWMPEGMCKAVSVEEQVVLGDVWKRFSSFPPLYGRTGHRWKEITGALVVHINKDTVLPVTKPGCVKMTAASMNHWSTDILHPFVHWNWRRRYFTQQKTDLWLLAARCESFHRQGLKVRLFLCCMLLLQQQRCYATQPHIVVKESRLEVF